MRSAAWETSGGALLSFLNSTTQCFMADLYTITLSGGTVIRYTSCDIPVVINGNTYAIGPNITRGKTRVVVGVEVDHLDLTFSADSTITINSVPLLQFIAGGGFDGARIVVSRAFASAPNTAWVGMVDIFQGRVNDVQGSRYEAQVTVNSYLELLNIAVPRNVYQPSCNNVLFDAACGLSKASFSVAIAATSVTDTSLTTFNYATVTTANYYAQGWAVCLTGANAGLARTIKSNATNSVQTVRPWSFAVAAGDTFTFYAGCDHQQTTCQNKFSNLIHFRGQPYVPAPETVT